MVVCPAEFDEYLRTVAYNIGKCDGVTLWRRGGWSKPENVGEDNLSILACFEGEAIEINREKV